MPQPIDHTLPVSHASYIYTYFNNDPQGFNGDMAKIYTLLASGELRPQIQVLPLDRAAEAHLRLEAGETTGKLVLTID